MDGESETRLARMEARLQELEDREAIRTLRCRYHECINEGRFAAIPDLFSEDAELDFAHLGKGKGRREIAAFFGATVGSGSGPAEAEEKPRLYRVKQFIHNHVVEISGDSGTGYAYLFATPVYAGEAYVVAARYDDEYVRRDGRWLFRVMRLTPYYMVPLKEGWAGDDLLKMGR